MAAESLAYSLGFSLGMHLTAIGSGRLTGFDSPSFHRCNCAAPTMVSSLERSPSLGYSVVVMGMVWQSPTNREGVSTLRYAEQLRAADALSARRFESCPFPR